MTKGYWVATVDVHDAERYKDCISVECYRSPDYQAVVALRVPVSTIDLVILEGYDGAQP